MEGHRTRPREAQSVATEAAAPLPYTQMRSSCSLAAMLPARRHDIRENHGSDHDAQ